jgi:hypothetical protein
MSNVDKNNVNSERGSDHFCKIYTLVIYGLGVLSMILFRYIFLTTTIITKQCSQEDFFLEQSLKGFECYCIQEPFYPT